MNEQQLNSTVKWFIGDHYGSKSVRKSHLKSCTYDMFSRFKKNHDCFSSIISTLSIKNSKNTSLHIYQNSKKSNLTLDNFHTQCAECAEISNKIDEAAGQASCLSQIFYKSG